MPALLGIVASTALNREIAKGRKREDEPRHWLAFANSHLRAVAIPLRTSQRKRNRTGAILTLELLLILPILTAIFLAIVEFSMLLMSMQRVQAASSAACRIATLPAEDVTVQQQAMRDAAGRALGSPGLIAAYELQSQLGAFAGDPVVVQISVPMTAAAPDLLGFVGFSLHDRQLVAHTQMCKQ